MFSEKDDWRSDKREAMTKREKKQCAQTRIVPYDYHDENVLKNILLATYGGMLQKRLHVHI